MMKERLLALLSSRWVNLFFFYLGWVVCIELVVRGSQYWGALFVLLLLLSHFYCTGERFYELLFISSVAVCGTFIDTFYQSMDWITYTGGYGEGITIAPLWVTFMWSLYASSVNHSLSWVGYSLFLSCFFGGLGGPLSYLAVEKMGGIAFTHSHFFTLSILSAAWICIVPASFWYARWLKGKLLPDA